MNLFKDVIFSWWQIGILKLSLLAIGMAAGSYFAPQVSPYITYLLVIGLILGVYVLVVWLRQP